MSASPVKKILLVEDEIIPAMAAKYDLEKYGYSVITAESGKAAIETAATDPGIDIILMDIDLGPGMDGTEAAAIILKKHALPVVFLSSHHEQAIVSKTEKINSYGYIVKGSALTVINASIKMAFKLFEAHKKIEHELSERSKAEKALKISERQLNDAQRVSKTGNWELDLLNNKLTWSDEIFRIFEIDREKSEISYESFLQAIHPDDRAAVDTAYKNSLKTHDNYKIAHRLSFPDGRIKYVEEQCETSFDSAGSPLISIGTVQDITERTLDEQALKESEKKFRKALEFLPIPIALSDNSGKIIFHNNQFMTTFGYTPDDVPTIEKWLETAYPDPAYRNKVIKSWSDDVKFAIKNNTSTPVREYFVTGKDGSVKTVLISAYFEKDVSICLFNDITDRRIAEEKIKTLLAEKDLLLKEAHHRIKNNINSVCCMLKLQTSTLKDQAAISALNDAVGRVKNMLVLYDKLYRTDNMNELSFDEFLTALLKEISINFSNSSKIKIEKQITNFKTDPQRIYNIGVIVNELVTNAMKYAFNGRDNGTITLSTASDDKHIVLQIKDDGTGIPETINFTNTSGFGLHLVEIMVRQLDGVIRIERNGGSIFILEFNL